MKQIVEYIKSNNEVPISSQSLSKIFGISGSEVRKVINLARCNGEPICSCTKGYYYSESSNDIQKTINSLKHRIESIQSAISGLSNHLGGVE